MSIEDELVKVFQTNKEIQKVILFGSRNTERYRDDSDYDICIVVDNKFNKESLLEEIYKFIKCYRVIIHPFIYSVAEYLQRIKIDVYQRNIIESGTVIYLRDEHD